MTQEIKITIEGIEFTLVRARESHATYGCQRFWWKGRRNYDRVTSTTLNCCASVFKSLDDVPQAHVIEKWLHPHANYLNQRAAELEQRLKENRVRDAAPDMLRVLLLIRSLDNNPPAWVVSPLGDAHVVNLDPMARKQLDEAIAKATGEIYIDDDTD